MPSPFPGMDPYLEHPDLWPEVHNRLLVAIADSLGPQLRPKYRVAIEKRVYEDIRDDLLVGRPDAAVFEPPSQETSPALSQPSATATAPITVELPMPEEIQERYLAIREVSTGIVVTILELISPSNKRLGRGRQQYEEKRLKILASQTHLVEIDLIRAFSPLPMRGPEQPSLYRILISCADQRPRADLYPFDLRSQIPAFPLPLQPQDPEIIVELQPLLAQLYDRASYDLAIDYSQDPVPPLTGEDVAWANKLLRNRRH
ncbi:hypothetical protein XM38_011900 [Halomicronema hongdechloris C2206]|uniref:DUF4058 domain-containing protein n=1 Tax=Halomicronema hongdechloris C2206 TaxID=1641165 RepID=A0A1Z3HIV6_9CYAN|nr:DUF4058 family protein [Halomicronema hongdechloris]ASC70254.1 hypothetical protein XM38_011900 [Halomicronema hongdechloris C2206]